MKQNKNHPHHLTFLINKSKYSFLSLKSYDIGPITISTDEF